MYKLGSLLGLFFFANLVYAQETLISDLHGIAYEVPKRVHFILEGGYVASMATDQEQNAKMTQNYSGGFVSDFLGDGYFNVETGLFITQQGYAYASSAANLSSTDLTTLTHVRIAGKLTYLGLPILAKVNLAGRPVDSLFLIAGVMPQFLMAKDISIQGEDANGATQSFATENGNYDPPSYDISAVVGIGHSYKFSSTKTILLQATYNRGFVAVNGQGPNVFNQSFLLTLGFGVDIED